ncbi:hypothetical protein GE573_01080 [Bacillus velezensis]|nr:hypothetical protein GE573_01080 [Bacillus velezensis]
MSNTNKGSDYSRKNNSVDSTPSRVPRPRPTSEVPVPKVEKRDRFSVDVPSSRIRKGK